ncbi:uncharacterized protein [Miscanthus floridulus]|uniref:uncharacterized protein n=1 Tax=Miscanthus floridulus TaxID=154761 RepID=UPI00345907E4
MYNHCRRPAVYKRRRATASGEHHTPMSLHSAKQQGDVPLKMHVAKYVSNVSEESEHPLLDLQASTHPHRPRRRSAPHSLRGDSNPAQPCIAKKKNIQNHRKKGTADEAVAAAACWPGPAPALARSPIGATARDAVIRWFRGEFAAANTMIDALWTWRRSAAAEPSTTPSSPRSTTAVSTGSPSSTCRRSTSSRMSPVLHMQKFYPVADVTSLGAAAGSHCYSEEEAASTVTHEPMEDLPAEAVPKAPSTEDDTVTDGQQQISPFAACSGHLGREQ